MVWCSRNRRSDVRRPLPRMSSSLHLRSVFNLTPPLSQWFGTYNFLDDNLPHSPHLFNELLRQAFIGFVASIVSDTISNSLRVVKTYRQVNQTKISYAGAAHAVIATDGLKGLFGRGLKTRILANGLQGLMFSVLWKLFLDL